MEQNRCKICGSSSLIIFAHTARCRNCKVLLYFPYPDDDALRVYGSDGKKREVILDWYSQSSFYNHTNFTNIVRFTIDESYKGKHLNILDYGGGGGQFALVCKSHFPQSDVYITDINDESLLQEWSASNIHIKFDNFNSDKRKFDFIFLNDVLEHLSDPEFVLKQLSCKLENNEKIFIDTPKQFWIYPFFKLLSKSIYEKVLKGTVSPAHLQIWSRKSFNFIVKKCWLKICKYVEVSEYTMPPDFYMKNMSITNPVLKLAGRVFYQNAKWLAKNKILCVLSGLNVRG